MARQKRQKRYARRAAAEQAPSSSSSSSARGRTAAYAALLAVVTALVYAPTLGHDFVAFDDHVGVQYSPAYNPPTFAKIGQYWLKPYPDMYTPILWTVWGVLAFVARRELPNGAVEFSAGPYHAFNVVAHAAAAVMAFLILRRLVRFDRAALLGAAVFALHPLQVESVAWVSGMKTPLSGFLALWATWHYLRYAELSPGRSARLHYAAATLAYLFGMITKPTVIVLPVIIAAIELFLLPRRSPVRRLVLTLTPWLVTGLLLGMFNAGAMEAKLVYRPAAWQRVLIALDSLTFYLRKLVLPYPLLPDYGRTPDSLIVGRSMALLWLTAIPSVALTVAAALLRRRAAWLTVSVIVFVAGAATTLGFISYSYQRYSTVADRYAYLSMFGAAVAVAYFVVNDARRWRTAVGWCAVGVCAVLTVIQCGHWNDSQTLFHHTLAHNPRSLAAYRGLVNDADLRGQLAEAVEWSRRGLAIHPADPELVRPFALGSFRLGRFEDAVAGFREWLKDRPPNAEEKQAFGAALARTGRLDEAEAMYKEAIALKPDYADAYANLGRLHAQRGEWDAALNALRRAADIAPDSAEFKSLLAAASDARQRAAATRPTTATTQPQQAAPQ